MILISSHIDRVRNDIPFNIKDGKISGLLDNSLGNFVSLSCLNNPSVLELHKQGKVQFFFSEHEEFGLDKDFPELAKKDFVINVDVCSHKRYNGKDVGIEQISKGPIKEVIENLKWEGYKLFLSGFTNAPDEEDEMNIWHKKGIPGCSFIIPIKSRNNNWHGLSTIEIEKVQKSILILQRLICYLS